MANTEFNDILKTMNIPSKKYFTIGEVSKICDLQPHVLRYWEKMFNQLKPSKRSGRRYYQHRDLLLVLEIKYLLYDQGYKIPGAVAKLGGNVGSDGINTELHNESSDNSDKNLELALDSDTQTRRKNASNLSINNVDVSDEIQDLLEMTRMFRSYIQKNY